MTSSTPESRARLAYTAYGRKVGFRTYDGSPMLDFDDLYPAQQDGWVAAAKIIWDLATTGRAVIE